MTGGWEQLVREAEVQRTTALAAVWADGRQQTWNSGVDRVADCMSVTKFVAGAVLGLVLDVADLDRPLQTWIPEWAADARAAITLRQVMSHRSGLQVQPSAVAYAAANLEALVLDLPLEAAPGGEFAYNNVAIQLMSIVVQRLTGRRMDELAGERLFAPLGIQEWGWQLGGGGLPLCLAGLQLRALDLAKVGSLYLPGGTDQQILPAAWVVATPAVWPEEIGLCAMATYAWIRRSDAGVDIGPHTGFGHTGDYGQYLTIQPEIGVSAVRLRTDYSSRAEDEMWPDFAERVRHHLAPP